MSPRPVPPYDPELAVSLDAIGAISPPTITMELVAQRRAAPIPAADEFIGDRPIVYEERTIPGSQGGPALTVTIFSRIDHRPGGPGICHFHGGGMVMGNRFVGIADPLDWVELLDAVAVTVEYRLAPDHPDPAPVEDCYSTLAWMAENAEALGFDPARLIVVGSSAGGGLSAGVALLARDRGGPALAGQVLCYPMLDDRNETVSSEQFQGIGVWDRTSNENGWNSLLGDRRTTDAVSIYAAPARATDLSGLPPAYIDCGSAEVFRDEDVAYASTIWASGGVAELHVWPGGFHGFDQMLPLSELGKRMRATRRDWVLRLLGG